MSGNKINLNKDEFILGIHNGLESGVCLLKNGKILEAVSEEDSIILKFTQVSPSYLWVIFKNIHFCKRYTFSNLQQGNF